MARSRQLKVRNDRQPDLSSLPKHVPQFRAMTNQGSTSPRSALPSHGCIRVPRGRSPDKSTRILKKLAKLLVAVLRDVRVARAELVGLLFETVRASRKALGLLTATGHYANVSSPSALSRRVAPQTFLVRVLFPRVAPQTFLVRVLFPRVTPQTFLVRVLFPRVTTQTFLVRVPF